MSTDLSVRFLGRNDDETVKKISPSGSEIWYKVELLCTDTVQFNRLELKLLKYELDKCLQHKHTLSKCKVLEDFLCKLTKEHQ